VRANVEREVKKRVEGRVKEQALNALLGATPLEIPKSLIAMESNGMAERAMADLKARGLDPQQVPINPQAFEETAKRRVALGLIIAELARSENLQPKPAEGARAGGAGGAKLRESRRGSKMVLHAAAAASGDGSAGAGNQCRQVGLDEGESARQACIV
jgi:hypothetical protein